MVTTFAYVAIAMGGLAGVFALWLLVRYVPQLRAQRWSALALWGMLSVFAAGALLVAGGSYRVGGYFRDQARQEETAIRHSLFVEDPVQSLLLRFEGANPFHERPEDCLLRLEVQLAPDRAFVSELTPSQLHPPSGNPEEAARKIDWATILDGISDAKGKQEAQKLAHIGDWRLVQKMHIEIVDRRIRGEKLPHHVRLRFNQHRPELFSAPAATPVERADDWAVLFTDTNSPKQRLDAPFGAALRPVEPTLGRSLIASFVGGALLICFGVVLRLAGKRIEAVAQEPAHDATPGAGNETLSTQRHAESSLPERQWRLSRVLLTTGVVFIVGFALWLTADQEICAWPSSHDDHWQILAGRSVYWLGSKPFTTLSFIKEPGYPLFVAVCYRLGLPLRLGTEIVYLAAAGFFSWSLVHRESRGWVGLLVFAVVVLHPASHIFFKRATGGALYVSLLLAAVGALLLQHKLRGEHGALWRSLLSGAILGVLWNTRPERPLVLVLLLLFVTVSVVREWRLGTTRWTAARAWFRAWVPAGAMFVLLVIAVMAANYARWGVFTTTAMSAPGYQAAYRALLSIEQEQPLRFVPVPQETRLRAYTVSPSFRELEPFLEGPSAVWRMGPEIREVYPDVPDGEHAAAWFCWALRDAAAAAGHFGTGPDSEAFFYRLAQEIHTAAAEGRLATRPVPPGSFDPCWDNYGCQLLPSFGKVWSGCWEAQPPEGYGNVPGDHVEDFDRVACRRSLSEQPRFQAVVRDSLRTIYLDSIDKILVAGGLVAVLVFFLGPHPSGRGMYFLAGTALALAGFSRLALFTLIDATSFPAYWVEYLFPATAVLTAMAVWCLAEGVRLLHQGGRNREFGSSVERRLHVSE
jgi:hypothetical protein